MLFLCCLFLTIAYSIFPIILDLGIIIIPILQEKLRFIGVEKLPQDHIPRLRDSNFGNMDPDPHVGS